MKKIFLNNNTIIHQYLFFKNLNKFLKNFLIISLGVFLLVLSAKIKIPIPPVPITLQTLVVLGFSMLAGSRLSFYTFILYLFLGSISVPVFANPPYGGPGYLLGPSGGYLLGMLLASYIVGYLAERNFDKNYFKSLLTIFLGTIIIFIPGIIWLGYWYNFLSETAANLNFYQSYDKAFKNGLLLYKFTEPVKIALTACITPILWKLKK